MNFAVSFFTLFYLVRAYRHLLLRSTWYLAVLILFLFISTTYNTTFIEFLISPSNPNFSFNGLSNIFTNWFTGNPNALLLVGLLYIVVKVSRSKISPLILLEVIFLSLGCSHVMLISLGTYNSIPIILALIASILIHSLKNIDLIINNLKMKFHYPDSLPSGIDSTRILSSLVFLFVIFSQHNLTNSIGVMSKDHLLRITIVILILSLTSLIRDTVNTKLLFSFLPIFLIYSGVAISSFIYNPDSAILPMQTSNLTLDCLASIAILPIIDYISYRYSMAYNYYISSVLVIPNNVFRRFVEFSLILLVSLYVLFLLTSS